MSDALDVVRLCWPEHEWEPCPAGLPCVRRRTGALLERDRYVYWRPTSHEHIAAAERVLVDERGLGREYGNALLVEMWGEHEAEAHEWRAYNWQLAAIRTASLEVCLRAMARVVRAQPKETK